MQYNRFVLFRRSEKGTEKHLPESCSRARLSVPQQVNDTSEYSMQAWGTLTVYSDQGEGCLTICLKETIIFILWLPTVSFVRAGTNLSFDLTSSVWLKCHHHLFYSLICMWSPVYLSLCLTFFHAHEQLIGGPLCPSSGEGTWRIMSYERHHLLDCWPPVCCGFPFAYMRFL